MFSDFIDRVLHAQPVMIIWLLLAGVFALGHDRFYASLNGKGTTTQTFSQQQNNSIGTAFAFCVQSSLSIAIGTAYVQCLWRVLLKNKLFISEIDSLTTLTTSALRMINLRLLRNFPLLFLLAGIYWTISISIVFPPGSLTVRPSLVVTQEHGKYDFVDWHQSLWHNLNNTHDSDSSLVWVNILFKNPNGTANKFDVHVNVPAQIRGLVQYLTLTNEVPPVHDAVLNSTFTKSFYGPTLNCSTSEWRASNITRCDDADSRSLDGSISVSQLGYIGWESRVEIPSGGHGEHWFGLPNYTAPAGFNGSIYCGETRGGYTTTFHDDVPPLHLAVYQKTDELGPIWNVTSCQMTNSSYSVDYSFQNGKQEVKIVTKGTRPLPQPLSDVYSKGDPTTEDDLPDFDIGPGSDGNAVLNYLTVLAAMYYVTTGQVVELTSGLAPEIFNTRLALTDELLIFNASTATNTADYYPKEPSTSFRWHSAIGQQGDFMQETKSVGPIAAQLEEFMRNLTVAVMTGRGLGIEQDLAYNLTQSIDVYIYDPVHLWIAYGIGLGITAAIVLLGLTLVNMGDGAGYSNKFSTFLRTIPPEEIEQLIYDEDRIAPGAEPLPEKVASSKLWLGMSKHSNYNSPLEEKKQTTCHVREISR